MNIIPGRKGIRNSFENVHLKSDLYLPNDRSKLQKSTSELVSHLTAGKQAALGHNSCHHKVAG